MTSYASEKCPNTYKVSEIFKGFFVYLYFILKVTNEIPNFESKEKITRLVSHEFIHKTKFHLVKNEINEIFSYNKLIFK